MSEDILQIRVILSELRNSGRDSDKALANAIGEHVDAIETERDALAARVERLEKALGKALSSEI